MVIKYVGAANLWPANCSTQRFFTQRVNGAIRSQCGDMKSPTGRSGPLNIIDSDVGRLRTSRSANDTSLCTIDWGEVGCLSSFTYRGCSRPRFAQWLGRLLMSTSANVPIAFSLFCTFFVLIFRSLAFSHLFVAYHFFQHFRELITYNLFVDTIIRS